MKTITSEMYLAHRRASFARLMCWLTPAASGIRSMYSLPGVCPNSPKRRSRNAYLPWESAKKESRSFPGNYSAKIGIIGAGMIGKTVIQMLKSYQLEVLTFDPFLPDATAEELGVEKVSLETLFRECQVVSNHLANNDQTVGMLNGTLFEKMRHYATFLNTGRGAQVVEADLIKVLKARSDRTAILDVTFPEPPEAGNELCILPNCILTPHIAGSSGNEVRRMGEYMKEEYRKLLKNEPCKYEVTLEMLKTMA